MKDKYNLPFVQDHDARLRQIMKQHAHLVAKGKVSTGYVPGQSGDVVLRAEPSLRTIEGLATPDSADSRDAFSPQVNPFYHS